MPEDTEEACSQSEAIGEGRMSMTENEAYKFIGQAVIESGKALEALQSIKSEAERIGKIGEYYANLDNCVREIEACRVAMQALEEIQQYRAIGTAEELQTLKEHIGAQVLRQYEAIGTVEEFKALKEKSVAKNIVVKKNEDITFFLCPQCNKLVGNSIMRVESSHCSRCGQKLDWSE